MVSKIEQYISVLMCIVNQVITFQIIQRMYYFSGAEDCFLSGGGGGGGGMAQSILTPVMKHSLKVFM